SRTTHSFSYCAVAHRDLHSFPTRRSSDLHKFVAAEAGNDVRGIQGAAQSIGNLAQKRITECMPQRVVDFFELIEVDKQQRIAALDRKSTRLNSSHVKISYAVFCLKKEKKP